MADHGARRASYPEPEATAQMPPRPGPDCAFCRRPLPARHYHVLDTELCAVFCVCPAHPHRQTPAASGRRRAAATSF